MGDALELLLHNLWVTALIAASGAWMRRELRRALWAAAMFAIGVRIGYKVGLLASGAGFLPVTLLVIAPHGIPELAGLVAPLVAAWDAADAKAAAHAAARTFLYISLPLLAVAAALETQVTPRLAAGLMLP